MQVVLSEQIRELGISEEQVCHMLKACNQVPLTDVYEPSYEQFKALLGRALELEAKKNRLVQLWAVAFSKAS